MKPTRSPENSTKSSLHPSKTTIYGITNFKAQGVPCYGYSALTLWIRVNEVRLQFVGLIRSHATLPGLAWLRRRPPTPKEQTVLRGRLRNTVNTVIYRCIIHSQPTEIWCTGPEGGLHAGETSFPSVIYYVNWTPFSCDENNNVLLSWLPNPRGNRGKHPVSAVKK